MTNASCQMMAVSFMVLFFGKACCSEISGVTPVHVVAKITSRHSSMSMDEQRQEADSGTLITERLYVFSAYNTVQNYATSVFPGMASRHWRLALTLLYSVILTYW